MGYEVHIVRKNNYDDYDESSNITFQEFCKLVDEHPDLSWVDNAGNSDDNKKFCYWINYPLLENNNSPWLQFYDYEEGLSDISTKWTDVTCLRKWLELAEILQAQLRGDENERYDKDEIDKLEKIQLEHSTPNVIVSKKPFWKFW